MWKNALNLSSHTKIGSFLNSETVLTNQFRTTYVLKRISPPGLGKLYGKPKPLKARHYLYEVVSGGKPAKSPIIDVILTTYIDGLGDIGDIVSLKTTYAYNKLLIPGLAVYATPENKNVYKKNISEHKIAHSSPFAQRTVNVLQRALISITMNKTTPWTLETWHVKTCLRKAGFHVPEKAIKMPSKPISGPDMNLEGKEFYVSVTVNNLEKANVRCRLHHWSTQITDKLPYVLEFWKQNAEPIFPEDAQILNFLKEKANEKF